MAAGTYGKAMQRVLEHEGGYSNHPSDPGGPTNWGITIIDARKYWKPDATAADVRRMPKEVAFDIYRKHYADPIHYDQLPAGVDYAVFDYGINSGVSRAVKVLQRIVGVPVDGQVGLVTLTAARAADPRSVVNALCDERLRFLQQLRTWPVFGNGWGRRVREVRATALALLGTAQPSPLPMRWAPGPTASKQSDAQAEGSAKGVPEAPKVKPLKESRSLWGAIVTGAGVVGTAISGGMDWITTPLGFAAFVLTLVLCGVGLWMIVSGRLNVQKLLLQFQDQAAEEGIATTPAETPDGSPTLTRALGE